MRSSSICGDLCQEVEFIRSGHEKRFVARSENMTLPFPFIVGRGRSGTTLLRTMFDSHPDVAFPPESHFIVGLGLSQDLYDSDGGFASDVFLRRLMSRPHFQRWELPTEDVRAAFDDGIGSYADAIRRVYSIYATHQGKHRYGDKTPSHVLHISYLAQLFSEGRFIHLIRDGRNGALSYLKEPFGPSTVGEAAIWWKRMVVAGRTAGKQLDERRYREVHYESLVEDPEATLRDLCEFIDVSFDEAMLHYYDRPDILSRFGIRASAHQNVHRAPTANIRDWRAEMSREDVALFEAIAGDLLSELGYERAMTKVPLSAKVEAKGVWCSVQMQRAIGRARKELKRWRRRSVG
jgi:Sulfotransferase family